MAFRGQSPPLIIVEAKAFSAVQLAQHPVLFRQVCIGGSVLFVHPAREHHRKHLQRRVQYPSTRQVQNVPCHPRLTWLGQLNPCKLAGFR